MYTKEQVIELQKEYHELWTALAYAQMQGKREKETLPEFAEWLKDRPETTDRIEEII